MLIGGVLSPEFPVFGPDDAAAPTSAPEDDADFSRTKIGAEACAERMRPRTATSRN